MPRTIELSVAPETADAILSRLEGVEGIEGLARQRGAALNPAGDVLVIHATNDAARAVFEMLEEFGVLEEGGVVTRSPSCLIPAGDRNLLDTESNEGLWDEMAFHLRSDTNLGFNYLALMFVAGAVAGAGLWADMLHVVVGAMVIAPAFEPLVRVPFGLTVGPPRIAMRGLRSCVLGYLMMALGGLAVVLVLVTVDPAADQHLGSRWWVRYWSSFSPAGVVASVFAAVAGAVVISGLRSVLTTGVMIALALVPAMAVVGMALGVGDLALAARGFGRWAVDAGLVLAASAVVFRAKQAFLHRRPGRS